MPPILIPANGSPTTSETTALAAMVPALTPPSKTTTAVLDEVLSLCQNPDVVSFLFTEDKIQLPYLTSPSLFSTAITGNMTATRVEPDHSRPTKLGSLSDFVKGKWVFVPAFSVSGVSLGFGMHEFNYSQADAWGSDYMMYLRAEFRFVRNEAKGELLILHDMPDMNACCIEYSRTVTPTCQTRTSICIFRDRLHEAAKSGYLDRNNVAPIIDQINTIYEYRNCPTCHHDHTTCRCALQLARARHPFDHLTFVKNMSQRLGTFQGVANVFCYDRGRFKRNSVLGCRTTMRGGIDHGLIVAMRDWAVGLHVTGTESPLQTITAPPQQDSEQSTYPTTEQNNHCDLSADQLNDPPSFWLGEDDPLSDLSLFHDMEEDLLPAPTMVEALDWKLEKNLPINTPPQVEQLINQTDERKKHAQPLIDIAGTAAVASETSSNASQGNGTNLDLVKMLKAEMRRTRNRESAHRSNMKKKAINDKLKCELKTSKEKADSLRMHESALRQENIRLRRLLAESGT